jgi:hypothetical protein
MEVSEVRQRVLAAIDHAKRKASEKRARNDDASREYDALLEQIAVPLFRQIANVLKAEGYGFTVFTPGGSVRLMSDKSAEDYIELVLDTSGERPLVVCHSSRARGRRVVESERAVTNGPVREMTEEQLLRFLVEELEPFVER